MLLSAKTMKTDNHIFLSRKTVVTTALEESHKSLWMKKIVV